MKQNMTFAVVGVAAAIAITTTMDATGLTVFSALPLFGLIVLFWVLQRFSKSEMGLKFGKPRHFLIAVAYPVIVMSLMTVLAFLGGAIDLSDANWNNTILNVTVGSTIGVLMVLITEEGFFRGWLWATLRRAGVAENQVLVWTTVAFMFWHISVVTLDTGFDLPLAQIPVYLINCMLIGAIWAKMRLMSGSVIVASVSHAVWNGFAYSLFGFGTHVGELGIQQTNIFGPEVGWIGVLFNLCFALGLWQFHSKGNLKSIDSPIESSEFEFGTRNNSSLDS